MGRRKKGDAKLKELSRRREEAEVEVGTSPPSKVGEKRRSRELGARSNCFEIGS
jgi:hypothetical protein